MAKSGTIRLEPTGFFTCKPIISMAAITTGPIIHGELRVPCTKALLETTM